VIAGSTLLYSRRSLAAACGRLAALGFEALDVGALSGWAHLDPADVADDPGRAAADLRDAAGDLAVVALNAGLGEQPERELDALCAVADRVGAAVVTVPAGPADADPSADLDRVHSLARAVDDREVALCVETHYDTLAETPSGAARYADLPGVGLTLDPSHFAVGGYPLDAYESLLGDVRHVHLRQAGDSWDAVQRPVDDGDLDFAALFAALADAGYGGHYAVEYIDSLEGVDPDEAEAQAVGMLARARELL
jgi:sugar phosphate isomerase/epimerase